MRNLILFLLIFILNTNIYIDYSYGLESFNLSPIELDYNFYDLNNFISTDTLKYSYCQYRAYLENLNYELKDNREFKNASLEDILTNLDSIPNDIALKVKMNASHALNYEYFFKSLSPEKTFIKGNLLKEINKSFSSFDNFKSEFKKLALDSKATWIFLAKNSQDKLYLTTSKEISCPIIYKHQIVLCLNIDEELYSNKSKLVDNFFSFVNWQEANKNFNKKNK
ncbi:Fe-Mn family superoxide dismutase [Intestinibacter sp.]|uniref:Fe-Mn family superoxide dismutase n=1 Tax=Intestinibacter sp. TaxID=1965304 RepID=UPI002A918172|nr:Fe-Mn family superoxide dismutase [Intestinibacter sp.]MDY5211555.1 Fe-Mn family superoxide dismutase [Intestinibacter sp.]